MIIEDNGLGVNSGALSLANFMDLERLIRLTYAQARNCLLSAPVARNDRLSTPFMDCFAAYHRTTGRAGERIASFWNIRMTEWNIGGTDINTHCNFAMPLAIWCHITRWHLPKNINNGFNQRYFMLHRAVTAFD